ncbi:DUF7716 domain-containing protein [Hyalangium gracile]|uniref:DUF7716 domain-containing protein n=1 Tax=Hyalangium gracile TaxID=394092 RepID=UPI001CCD8756|nr:hypothetical protein [Hyalangium gracile]
MSSGQLTTLGKILRAIKEPTRGYALYMRGGLPWAAHSEACILERDLYSDDLPPFAEANGLVKILSAAQVLEVVDNARLQKPNVSEQELVEALAHYCNRDAFIEFSG